MQIDNFLARWRNAGGSERANYQLFITDLCALLEVDKPQPANEDTRDNAYVFERRVIFHHGDGSASNGFIDCYRRGAFIGEAKTDKRPWPPSLPGQVAAIAQLLVESPLPLGEPEIASRFTGKGQWKKRLPQLLETLVALGRARQSDDGRFGASK